MNWVFWISFAAVVCAYLGYPLWLYLRAKWRPRPARAAPIFPSVSIVMAVHNEEHALPAKLANLAELDYPEDKLEIVVVSDGSSDATIQVLQAHGTNRVRAIVSPEHQGKACALNQGIQAARGEVIVFTDARQMLEPQAVSRLVVNLADPSVGCVSGELLFGEPDTPAASNGIGYYWKLEKKIRQWEGVARSVVGATGALYGVRKELIVPLPAGTILDDVYIPLHVARQGARVVFEPEARAYDRLVTTSRQEFRRKVRTLTGNYQLLQLAPWLLTRANPVRFEFVCHKLLRLMMPFALAALLVSSLFLSGTTFELSIVFLLAFFSLAALAIFRPKVGFLSRLAEVSLAFLVLNTAAAVAFVYFVTGKKNVWLR